MSVPRLKLGESALLVVDIQERLLPHMHNAEQVRQQSVKLAAAAAVLEVPTIVTEQYRKGLGATVGPVTDALPEAATVHEKLKFSACIDPVRKVLSRCGARSVVVCGIEAHVCVLQTCLDLADAGLTTAVVVDAVGSRRAQDQTAAEARLTQAGVIPTTAESVIFEWVHEAGGERFKAVLPLVK